MSKISIKKDFKNGEKLYDTQLNNNFKVIEAGVNANESSLEETIEKAETRLQKELTDITADRGWDWNGGDRVTFFKGNDEQVTSQPIKNGQLLYNTNTGETALDDAGKRVVTGSGNVVEINNGSTPSNPATKLWIDRNKIVKTKASQVTTSMDGDDLNMAPAVKTVKDYVKKYVDSKHITYLNSTQLANGFTPTEDCYIELYGASSGWGYAGAKTELVINNTAGNAKQIVKTQAGTEGHDTIPDSMFTTSVYKLTANVQYKFTLGEVTGGNIYSGFYGKLIPFI